MRRISWWDALPLGVGIIAGVLGLMGIPQSKNWVNSQQLTIGLLALTLAALVLFHVREANIGERASRELYQNLQLWLARLTASGQQSLDAIFIPAKVHRVQSSPGWLSHVVGANTRVMVIGMSCVNLLQLERSAIAAALASGATFQFLLLAPDASFLKCFDPQMSYAAFVAGIPNDIQRSVGILHSLKQHGSISWQFYKGPPVYSAVWLRAEDLNKIEVQFYGYSESPAERLTIEVDERYSPTTYAYFVKSLETLWAASYQDAGTDGA